MTPNVLMVFPRFNPNSFWSLQAACDLWGARCPSPPLGLITLAALLPQSWNMRLVNRNAEELTEDDIAWADMVMTGGMLVQRLDAMDLIDRCQARGKPVVVGGPDVTSSPEIYERADFLVLGEAEGIIDRFVEAWTQGERRGVFRAEKFKVDVTKSPIPRFDLLKRQHYLYIGVQFSRGCPFNCEFCDIIELYGRVPRSKSIEQMLSELDALYQIGYRGHVDFVDDNLIGNKKALKQFLPALRDWQRARGYPFKFSTEASINLADDAQLLRMMSDANFFLVFVGIESPDTETLVLTQKKQNTRRSLAESVHRIYAAGMFVTAGFIVGFDTEKGGVADAMVDCIEATSIPWCMVGMLTALPNTQLSRRLEKEGRMLHDVWRNEADQCTGGLNFVTLRPRREVLSDYKAILQNIYAPDAFFARVRNVSRALKRPSRSVAPAPAAAISPSVTPPVSQPGPPPAPAPKMAGRMLELSSKWASWRVRLREIRLLLRVMWRMTVRRPDLRRHFWSVFIECARRNPAALESVVTIMVVYLHLGTFAQYVVQELDRKIEAEQGNPLPSQARTLQIA
ncbi:B12-binding domain-containing radical SAM protein [Vineibacter terrae]|uniref:B12-binding domain-containing radical SAM protein n=1 Tax=Vineibacter terrae TaxID=2586908 RepID=UPI002E322255|nr:B12-binding domain-containing radical SAM protein [Vineibacter terrae]HEX2887599.1 B12-binding domain-containing radical SAM protein [Vineibacter terrae]